MTEIADPQTELLESPLAGLEARQVSAWFGKHKVLERVSLEMPPGTRDRADRPVRLRQVDVPADPQPDARDDPRRGSSAGEVLLAGQDIYHPSQRPQQVRRRIGMVFQKPNPFPTMSIYDNVISGLRLAGIKVRDKDALVESCLRRAGPVGRGPQPPVHSRRRAVRRPAAAAVHRAVARRVAPDVLLMDEPCSALDPTSTRRVEETIAEISSQVTIVIVTHNMQQAQRVSHYCAFFLAGAGEPGGIVESGTTSSSSRTRTTRAPRTTCTVASASADGVRVAHRESAGSVRNKGERLPLIRGKRRNGQKLTQLLIAHAIMLYIGIAGLVQRRNAGLPCADPQLTRQGGRVMKISVKIDGVRYDDDVEPRLLLVHYLREQAGRTGTPIGCDTSNCGACTVCSTGGR